MVTTARLLVAFVLCIAGTVACADEPVLDAGLAEQVHALALGDAQGKSAHRVEVIVGQLDPRLHLAPCQKIEPYLPANARLWGKARIGLRCKQGTVAWNVYLPVTIKVWGKAWVLADGGAAGHKISGDEVGEAEVDLAEESTPIVADRNDIVGRSLAQALRPGQAVRQGHIKARQWFAAGETVRVIVAGEGFALEGEGQALGNGIEGQPARVRTDSGRVLVGVATGERRMELTP